MSSVVDNRVVKMDFDNTKFLSGISSSLKGLSSLTSGINKASDTTSFNNLGTSMSSISSAVQALSDKFSGWGIVGMSTIANLTTKLENELLGALNKVKAQIDSLTTEQVSAGWTKFGEKSEAVATIMAATGESVETVSEQMNRLNWFTDETSYNFTDMADNIGKFTANQIPLEDAVTEMEGIATWASLSGQGVNEASRAMYNMAQAIGVGSVKLMDWKSIENANMATASFKQQVLDAAVAVGTLTKSEDGLYQTTKGTEVSIKNFSSTLSEGWFDTATLEKVLSAYGNFSQGINDLYNELSDFGYLTADIVGKGGLLDQFEEGTLDIQKLSKETGQSVEHLTEEFEYLTSEENSIGREAFKSAQECKTLAQALDATKDAASTAWMNIFETLFGNVEEATVIWSDFCQWMYEVFVEPLFAIQDDIQTFVDEGGMATLEHGLGQLGEIVTGIVSTVTEALSGKLANVLIKVANKIDAVGTKLNTVFNNLQENGSIAKLVKAFENFGDSINEIFSAIKSAFKDVFPEADVDSLTSVFDTLINQFDKLSKMLDPNKETLQQISNIFKGLFTVVKDVATALGELGNGIFPVLLTACTNLLSVVTNLLSGFSSLITTTDESGQRVSFLGKLFDSLSGAAKTVIDLFNSFSLSEAWNTALQVLSDIWDKLKEIGSKVKEVFVENDIDLGKALGLGVKAAAGVGIVKILSNIAGILKNIKSFNIKDIIQEATDGVGGLLDKFKSIFAEKDTLITSIKNLAISIGVLAASFLVLSLLDYTKVAEGLGAVTVAIAALMAGIGIAAKFLDAKKMLSLSASLLVMAAAVLVFAVALAVLAVDVAIFAQVASSGAKAWAGLGMMAVTIIAVGSALAILADTCSPVKLIAAATAMLVMSAAMLVLAVAFGVFVLACNNIGAAAVAMVMLAGVVIVVVAALKMLDDSSPTMLLGAAAMLVMAAAILVLAVAFAAFAVVVENVSNIVTVFATFASVVGVMALVLVALGAAGPAALIGAAAMLVAAAACIGFAAALTLVSVALPILAAGLTALGAALNSFITDVEVGIGNLGTGIEIAITAIGTGVSNAIKALGTGITTVISGFYTGIGDAIGKALESISKGISSLGDSLGDIADGIERIAIAATQLAAVSWLGTATGIGAVSLALSTLSNNGYSEFEDGTNRVITVLTNLTTEFINTVQKGINVFLTELSNTSAKAISVTTQMGTACTNVLLSMQGSFQNAGYYCAIGFANGISSGTFYAEARAAAMAQAAYNAACRTLRIHSPSRVFAEVGKYTAEGFAKGIDDNADQAETSAAKMANEAAEIASEISEAIDSDLVIKPVLDLSNVESGASSISSMLNGASVSTSLSSQASRDYSKIQNGSVQTTQTVTLDSSSLAAILSGKTNSQAVDVKINFEGNLAQLAKVLQPEIVKETNRRGMSLIN